MASRTEPNPTPAPKWLADYWGRVRHSIFPALVIASIVHLLQAAHVPLEWPARIAAQLVAFVLEADAAEDARSTLAVAVISKDRFESHYHGKTPLDRCLLKGDLEKILDNKRIATVAVDFYLSPRVSRLPYDVQCQQQLDELLRTHAKKLILVSNGKDDEDWIQGIGARAANPDIFEPLGIVTDHRVHPDRPGLGTSVALALCAPPDKELPAPPPMPEYCRDVRKDGKPGFVEDGKPGHELNPVSMRALLSLHARGEQLDITSDCFTNAAANCDVRHVLIGAGYGGDTFLTSAGERHGVQVHAAIAAQPRGHTPHSWGFAADVLLGAAVIGPLVGLSWRRYFKQRIGAPADGGGHRGDPRLAYLHLIGLAASLLTIVAALFVLSLYIHAKWQWWISPVPMALGMAIEGMVTGSVENALPLLGAGHGAHAAAPGSAARALAAALPRTIALALILLTVLDLTGVLT